MGKTQLRLKGKGKRWAKGQSSSSNPESMKYRNAARSRFFQPNLGASNTLTVGALKKLNGLNLDKNEILQSEKMSESDAESAISGSSFRTFQTFATDWSECSNQSFSRLMKNFRFDSLIHKEMLAVLAAVTEVIKSNGGNETTTEYFGALMTTLEVSDTEESLTAVLSLLGMGIKTVPQEVLRLKFAESSKSLMNLLAKFSDSDNNIILRSILGCLSVILRAQDKGTWSNPSTVQVFHSILVFTTHSKPKIRKAAQHAICAVLKGSSLIDEDSTHPGASHAAKFCCQQIESYGRSSSHTTVLHVLHLLKEILSTFPKQQMKVSCENILKIMTLGNTLITCCSLQALHGLFISKPPPNRMTPELNAQIINALYDYQPSVNDVQATVAWLTVMQEAFCNISRSDGALFCINTPKLFLVVSNLWLCENSQIINAATLTLRCIIIDCLDKSKQCQNYLSCCKKIFETVENGLKYQYHNAWSQVLNILGTFFEVIGHNGETFMKNCLTSLADLRDSYKFTYLNELDHAIGKAVRYLGPEIVLKAAPFKVTGEETNYEFSKSWMLPILKDNIHTSSLNFFIQYFLPMASICRRKALQLKSANDRIGSHSYDLLQCQIWSLLPAFCNNPTDVKENFKVLAKILGSLISDNKDVRLPVMTALRKLITRNKETKDEESIKELGRFAKNYLPILFSLYTTQPAGSDEEGQRLAALETIKVYLSIANEELCGELFDKAFLRLNTPDLDQFLKESMMDLLKVLLPYQDHTRLSLLYSKCLELLRQNKNKKDQKKSYRLLEELCRSESSNCKAFLQEKLIDLMNVLLKSLKISDVTSKGARLRCILYLIRLLPSSQFHIIKNIVPEAVICCKDINEKCRACAYQLLEEMLTISQKWSNKSGDIVIRDYIGMLLGGLAGTPKIASATVLALSKLTYTLRIQMPPDLFQLLIENICILLASSTREIVGSCLSFIKLLLTSFKQQEMLPYVAGIVKALVSMTDDCKRHFRLKTRDILDRLVRKFSYETIQALVPQTEVIMLKRLKNLRKINARKKKLKEEKLSVDNDDDDDDDHIEEFSVKGKPKSIEEILASSDDESEDDTKSVMSRKSLKQKRTTKKSQTFIHEGGEEIVDLMSSVAISKISASKPGEKNPVTEQKTKKDHGFKTASDGRLIIADDSEDEIEKSKNVHLASDSDEDSDEDRDTKSVKTQFSKIIAGRKRKMSTSSGLSEPALKYQAGGSGIHRPISNKKQEKKKNKERQPNVSLGSEYKAKKSKGDIKLKGKLDPYAYLPLSRKMLNRRKKTKNVGQFKNIIKSAKKGAKMGARAKLKKKK